jgi:hypothetical protein
MHSARHAVQHYAGQHLVGPTAAASCAYLVITMDKLCYTQAGLQLLQFNCS